MTVPNSCAMCGGTTRIPDGETTGGTVPCPACSPETPFLSSLDPFCASCSVKTLENLRLINKIQDKEMIIKLQQELLREAVTIINSAVNATSFGSSRRTLRCFVDKINRVLDDEK